eukprot:gene7776-19439_t
MAQTLYEELPQDTLAALHRYALNTRRNGGGATEGNKYRKIKLSNPIFRQRCWAYPAAKALMLENGWTENIQEGCLILPPDKECDDIVDVVRVVAGYPQVPHTEEAAEKEAAVSSATTAGGAKAAVPGKSSHDAGAAGAGAGAGAGAAISTPTHLPSLLSSPAAGAAAPITVAAGGGLFGSATPPNPSATNTNAVDAVSAAIASAGGYRESEAPTLPQAPSDDTVLSAASSTSTSASASASAAIASGGQQQQRGGDDDAAADVFAANAQTLCDMGFTDRAKNVQALQRTGGNIELALADIMGDEGATAAAPPPSEIQNIPPSQRHRNANPTQLHRWEVQFESPTQSGSAEVQTNCATWDKMKLNARTRMPRDFAKQLGCRPADVVVTVIRKIEGTDG